MGVNDCEDMLAYELAFKYRNPVVLLCDGYLGQMTGKVTLPESMVKPGMPDWAVCGDRSHRRNLIASIALSEADLEKYATPEEEADEAEALRNAGRFLTDGRADAVKLEVPKEKTTTSPLNPFYKALLKSL